MLTFYKENVIKLLSIEKITKTSLNSKNEPKNVNTYYNTITSSNITFNSISNYIQFKEGVAKLDKKEYQIVADNKIESTIKI
jgi:uncharacterized protein YueI